MESEKEERKTSGYSYGLGAYCVLLFGTMVSTLYTETKNAQKEELKQREQLSSNLEIKANETNIHNRTP